MVSSHRWLASYPTTFDWDVAIAPQPMPQLLFDAETRYPHHTAIDFFGKKTSYAQLSAQVRRAAAGLQALGVTKGTRVGICMPNCPQFVVSYYAILLAGGTVVHFNPLYSVPELRHQLNDSGVEIMITVLLAAIYPKLKACLEGTTLHKIIVSEFQSALPLAKHLAFSLTRQREIAPFTHDLHHVRFAQLLDERHRFTPVGIDPKNDIALVQYTGGTTGTPKGALLTHANLYANTVQCGLWFTGLTPGEERILGVLPLFHVFAMTTVMNLAVHTGSAMLLHPRFDIKALLRDMAAQRPTLMAGVPTMFAALASYRDISLYDVRCLKMCISGGGPLPQDVKNAFEAQTGCTLVEGYGLTEASPVVSANPLFGVNKPASIGLPFPATEIEVRDSTTPGEPLPTGVIGELWVRGPQIMQAYHDYADETAACLQQGWLRTGDMGYQDEEGYFYLVDRLKEMIISGGYNIYPRHIEEALHHHPAIAEAAVIGVPHPERIQVPKAFVVLKPGKEVSEAALRAYLKNHLAAYAVPHQIEFRSTLPKSAIGKVLKKDL